METIESFIDSISIWETEIKEQERKLSEKPKLQKVIHFFLKIT